MCKKCDTILDYAFMCHKIPERSFHIKGKQLPLCARCTGILIGYFIGIILLPFYVFPMGLSAIFLALIVIDGSVQLRTKYESNNLKRVITGLLAGIGIIHVLANLFLLGYHNGF